jgi:hypothetical protein
MFFMTPLLIFYSSWHCLPDRDTFFFQKRKYPKKLALRDFLPVLHSMKRGMIKPVCRQAGSPDESGFRQ